MTRPGIEPRSPRPLANTLTNGTPTIIRISDQSGPGSNANKEILHTKSL